MCSKGRVVQCDYTRLHASSLHSREEWSDWNTRRLSASDRPTRERRELRERQSQIIVSPRFATRDKRGAQSYLRMRKALVNLADGFCFWKNTFNRFSGKKNKNVRLRGNVTLRTLSSPLQSSTKVSDVHYTTHFYTRFCIFIHRDRISSVHARTSRVDSPGTPPNCPAPSRSSVCYRRDTPLVWMCMWSSVRWMDGWSLISPYPLVSLTDERSGKM